MGKSPMDDHTHKVARHRSERFVVHQVPELDV